MGRVGTKYKEVIELFDEKTGYFTIIKNKKREDF